VLSTHNLDEVERIATRVGILRTRLVALDTPTALRARVYGKRLRVTLGQAAAAFAGTLTAAGFHDVRADGASLSVALDTEHASVPLIVRRLVESGADVYSVVAEEPRLEDVYLRLLEGAGA